MKATLSVLLGLAVIMSTGIESASARTPKQAKTASQIKSEKTVTGLRLFQRAQGKRTLEKVFRKTMKPSDFQQVMAKARQLKRPLEGVGLSKLSQRRFEFAGAPGKTFESSKDGRSLRHQGIHFELQAEKSFLANFRKTKNLLKANRPKAASWQEWLIPSAHAETGLTPTLRPEATQAENEDYLANNITTLLYYMNVWSDGEGEVQWASFSEEPAVRAARASIVNDERKISSIQCFGESSDNLSIEFSDGSTATYSWLLDEDSNPQGMQLSQKSGARVGDDRTWPISGPTKTSLEGEALESTAWAIQYYCQVLGSSEQQAAIVERMNEAFDPANETPFVRDGDDVPSDAN